MRLTEGVADELYAEATRGGAGTARAPPSCGERWGR